MRGQKRWQTVTETRQCPALGRHLGTVTRGIAAGHYHSIARQTQAARACARTCCCVVAGVSTTTRSNTGDGEEQARMVSTPSVTTGNGSTSVAPVNAAGTTPNSVRVMYSADGDGKTTTSAGGGNATKMRARCNAALQGHGLRTHVKARGFHLKRQAVAGAGREQLPCTKHVGVHLRTAVRTLVAAAPQPHMLAHTWLPATATHFMDCPH